MCIRDSVRGVVKERIDVADQQPQHLGMDVRMCDWHTQLDMHAGRRGAEGRGPAWWPAKEARLVGALSSVRHEAQHDGIEGYRHGDGRDTEARYHLERCDGRRRAGAGRAAAHAWRQDAMHEGHVGRARTPIFGRMELKCRERPEGPVSYTHLRAHETLR